jgi:hypothetical protein
MSENLRHWIKLCAPPEWALKPIQAGRLKGKSDINPQWRMMAMTDTFGPCGEGWKYTIDKLWMERGAVVKSREGNIEREEVAAFALVSVCVKVGEHWSEPIPGIGGSMFTEMEKSGPFNSDEAYKMAVTDALSVAFKALGVAANVYSGDRFDGSKYSRSAQIQNQKQEKPTAKELTADQAKYFPRIKAALDTLHGSDIAAKKATIKANTAMPAKDNFPARDGIEDYRTLDGKRVEYLAHTLEKLAAKVTPELCNECRQPVNAHADSCPNATPPE